MQSGRGTGVEDGRELRVAAIDMAVEHICLAAPCGWIILGAAEPPAGGAPVVPLTDGTPLAITQAERRNGVFPDAGLGAVGSGPLVAPGRSQTRSVQRLSKSDPLAFNPQAATLADGTVIASWENAASSAGNARPHRVEGPTP